MAGKQKCNILCNKAKKIKERANVILFFLLSTSLMKRPKPWPDPVCLSDFHTLWFLAPLVPTEEGNLYGSKIYFFHLDTFVLGYSMWLIWCWCWTSMHTRLPLPTVSTCVPYRGTTQAKLYYCVTVAHTDDILCPAVTVHSICVSNSFNKTT